MRTLGNLFALQSQGQAGSGIELSSAPGVFTLVADSTPVAKAVLGILVMLSIASWGIFLYKWWTFRRASRQSTQFIDVFRRSSKFSEVQAICRSLEASPLVGLFQSGYTELTAQLRQASPDQGTPANPRPPGQRPTLKSLSAVDRSLMRASMVEVNKLELWVSWLATTASIAPFIGLFGTVWGIMSAFLSISQTGTTNLQQVGPGIAEALIATAAGLAAAIPAVLFYNGLTQRIKVFASGMDDFAMEFLNIAERNFT
ncbi:MAG: MotA/TolQ/ExbB proton channel family protein [Acidobacteriota bacterium]